MVTIACCWYILCFYYLLLFLLFIVGMRFCSRCFFFLCLCFLFLCEVHWLQHTLCYVTRVSSLEIMSYQTFDALPKQLCLKIILKIKSKQSCKVTLDEEDEKGIKQSHSLRKKRVYLKCHPYTAAGGKGTQCSQRALSTQSTFSLSLYVVDSCPRLHISICLISISHAS